MDSMAGVRINPYIWCAVGAAIGWLAGNMAGKQTHISRIEDVLVGVFGAFVGGSFLVSMVSGAPAPDAGFSVVSLFMAIVGGVTGLLLLGLMRRVVGPLKAGKSRTTGRR
jgi:uncharacterized membrane protein YeaQ/YmgE (transglycosylase-associated protein family)